MNAKLAVRLVEYLENIRARPAMYFGGLNVNRAKHFLNGLRSRAREAGCADHQIWVQVASDRGWEQAGKQLCDQMRERGMTPAQAIDEMLVIEIEATHRLRMLPP